MKFDRDCLHLILLLRFEGNNMSASSKTFDLRELLGDLFSIVKERAAQASSSSSSKTPAEAQLKTAILASISVEARNTQEIMTAIALSSGGALRPTSGQVQTNLNLLSEDKLVSSKTDGDRKVYAITKIGKDALKSAAITTPTDDRQSDEGESRYEWSTMNLLGCDATLLKAASKLAPVLIDLAQTASREQQKHAAKVLDEARHKLHRILAED
jgi:DNA-binding PadR family transcriptional regulator